MIDDGSQNHTEKSVIVSGLSKRVADAMGFEPMTSALEGQRLIQARPRAHDLVNTKYYFIPLSTCGVIRVFRLIPLKSLFLSHDQLL